MYISEEFTNLIKCPVKSLNIKTQENCNIRIKVA